MRASHGNPYVVPWCVVFCLCLLCLLVFFPLQVYGRCMLPCQSEFQSNQLKNLIFPQLDNTIHEILSQLANRH